MDIARGNELYELTHSEHPTYWVRIWAKPQVENPGPDPIAWNADSYRITGAVDVQEVFAWAAGQDGWPEIFVELPNADPPAAVVISGFNLSRSDGRPPAEYVSDSRSASKLSALIATVD